MTFCSDCGEELQVGKKFCSGCGSKVEKIIQETNQPDESSFVNQESIFDDNKEKETFTQKSTKEQGKSLEDMVEQIMISKGYSTETRKKIKGQSGEYNEIDVLATNDQDVIAIECKNYSEDYKVGVSEVRDFCSKLADLEIDKGLVITGSNFSQDAVGWSSNNPQGVKIELWNGEKLSDVFRQHFLGREGSGTVKIYDCLEPQDEIKDYTELLLKNKNTIKITKQDLIFYPFYITEFSLREQFRTPDKQMHTSENQGTYFVDGITKKILSRFDKYGGADLGINSEQKQIVKDILEYDQYKSIEIQKIDGSENIQQLKPSMNKQDIEFSVKKDIINDNKAKVDYSIRRSKEVIEQKQFKFTPNMNLVKLQSKVVFVPKMEIVFDSHGKEYKRTILPASGSWVLDEIEYCNNRKHTLTGKKETYAVCEVCGIAKCEDHILVDNEEMCFCKDHASEELKESKKGPSLKEKFGRFSFKKK